MRIWGFDIGTTSIGGAVLDYDERREEGKVLWLGTRIFPEAIVPEGGGSSRVTRNKQRRSARLIRRQTRRRRKRRRDLTRLLSDAALLPRFGTTEWNALMRDSDPYTLRAKGCGERLEPHEVGRALYHLVKRRGFKSARLREDRREQEDEKEEGVVKQAISELSNEIGDGTLGQWLKRQNKKRGRYLGRDMVRKEFDRLWASQTEHYPHQLTDDLKQQLEAVAFFQRPTFWRLATLGTCLLEPDSPLLAKSSWLGQRFVMLQKLNSLRLAGGNARPLTEEERSVVLAALERRQSLTFGAIRKLLKPLWEAQGTPFGAKFNYEVGSKDKDIPGNRVEAELIEICGLAADDLRKREEIRMELDERLRTIHYRQVGNARIEIVGEQEVEQRRQVFVTAAVQDWNVSEAQAEALSRLRPAPGWLRHSQAAVRKLLPHLEAGRLYSEAVDEAYPGRRQPQGKAHDRLPSRQSEMPEVRNPTVVRALNELRKVVNNLLRVHGRPDVIRIELAREVKAPPAQRAEILNEIRRRERERKKAAEELRKRHIANPSGLDIEKWLLWQECHESCPYTGKKIGFDDLFGSAPTFQVEHIFPRSRTLDNRFGNKTLCHVEVNIEKRDKSPYQAFYGTPRWETIQNALKAADLPAPKARRFVAASYAELGEPEGEERLLRDTSYAARAARVFLLRLFPPAVPGAERVEVVNGRLTNTLGRLWGIYSVMNSSNEKNREDHRHHALDALIVALTSRAFVERLADRFRSGHQKGSWRRDFPKPWPTLREDAAAAFEQLVVSHRSWRKVNGALHDQMALGDTGETKHRRHLTYRRFVKREDVATLSSNAVEQIRDRHIRKLAQARLAEHGGNAKSAFRQPLTLVSRKTGEVRKIHKIRRYHDIQTHLVAPLRPGPKTFAKASKNHHMAVHIRRDGSIAFDVVSRFEAMRRLSAREPIVARVNADGDQFVFSICSGDMLAFPGKDGEPAEYGVVREVWVNGQIKLQDHRDAGEATIRQPMVTSIVAAGACKVAVDPIGRVRPARD